MKKKFTVIALLVILTWVSLSNAQWVRVSGGMATNKIINCLTTGSNHVILAATNDSGIFRSHSNGINWIHCSQVPVGVSWRVYAWGSVIFAGSNGNGIYRSTDNGTSWTQENAGLTTFDANAFIRKDTLLFVGFYSNGRIYRSSNNGIDWYTMSSGLPSDYRYVYDFGVVNNSIFVCAIPYGIPTVVGGGVYKSTNNGMNWIAVNGGLPSPPNLAVETLEALDTLIFAGTSSGVYRSSNSGSNWSLSNQGVAGSVKALHTIGSNIVAGTTNGFFRSTNHGNTWTVKNEGLDVLNIKTITVDNNYIYVGTNGGSVYRRPLNEIIVVGIQNITNEIPDKCKLAQNYPNPFNPTTNIKFDIPNRSVVKLVIYNSLGMEVATLVNEELIAGSYKADWDAGGYPSGVYFYRIEAEDFVQTKSMMLLK